jgi:hypothetical protein
MVSCLDSHFISENGHLTYYNLTNNTKEIIDNTKKMWSLRKIKQNGVGSYTHRAKVRNISITEKLKNGQRIPCAKLATILILFERTKHFYVKMADLLIRIYDVICMMVATLLLKFAPATASH